MPLSEAETIRQSPRWGMLRDLGRTVEESEGAAAVIAVHGANPFTVLWVSDLVGEEVLLYGELRRDREQREESRRADPA